ncbi:hypothetical protein ASPFODRAFT_465844 [Aspergillus luchuensis CBS 106.47]|uniref:Uncharacterized protein n=1 Tax=Aspergillus luchuensis (strain CBS 106.47) TaxID=1137211 RepID=A0A1M3T019_ASPLC|nr:hypothetical protein ASPFODRAFT_521186 [Aspergillus luchuensis CBS 106.47]OJZ80078.1 hypothetical protein ASPFODRAFT_465844 [Aspergillus luchuensis CBS 106.47]
MRIQRVSSQRSLVNVSVQGMYDARTCCGEEQPSTIVVFGSKWTRGGYQSAAVHPSLANLSQIKNIVAIAHALAEADANQVISKHLS